MERKYYAAYKGKELIGFVYKDFGKRGGLKCTRWLEPVRRHASNSNRKEYEFYEITSIEMDKLLSKAYPFYNKKSTV